MPVDTVFVRAIRLDAFVGLHPWEKEVKQPIEVDVDAEVDTAVLLGTGAIKHGVDYSFAIKIVQGVVQAGHVELLEVLADRVAIALLRQTVASRVRVEIRKYRVCEGEADHVGVVVRRDRSDA